MTKIERNEIVLELAKKYLYHKNNDSVFARTYSRETIYNEGVLIGFCMAFEYTIQDDGNKFTIIDHAGKQIVNLSIKEM